MWILTRAINQYDQDGEYFESAWIKKPTKEQLSKLFGKDKKLINHVLDGGGRVMSENMWYYLTEIKEGEEYKSRI